MTRYQGYHDRFNLIAKSYQDKVSDHYNGILTFTNASGGLIVDGDGNYNVETIAAQEVKVKFVQKKDPNIINNPGTDKTRTYLEGYLVDPKELAGKFANHIPCTLIQKNIETKGDFYFNDSIPTALNEVNNVSIALGQKITGYFEANHNNI